MITYSTSASGTSARRSASRIAFAPSSTAVKRANPPANFPNGVRAALRITLRLTKPAYQHAPRVKLTRAGTLAYPPWQ